MVDGERWDITGREAVLPTEIVGRPGLRLSDSGRAGLWRCSASCSAFSWRSLTRSAGDIRPLEFEGCAPNSATLDFMRSTIASATWRLVLTTTRFDGESDLGNRTTRDCADLLVGPPAPEMISANATPWKRSKSARVLTGVYRITHHPPQSAGGSVSYQ
jgi:hypothetical protein